MGRVLAGNGHAAESLFDFRKGYAIF